MAKKTASRRSSARGSAGRSTKAAKPSSKSAAKFGAAGSSKTAGRASAGAKARGTRGTQRAKAGAGAKPAAKRTSGARAKASSSAAQRAFKDRQQPETLRLKNLSASLTADDVEASLKFYVDGLGFHVKQRWEENGKLLGAELVAGPCMIGISQDDWAKGRNRTKGVGLSIYAETTQGVDKLAERLRARGVDFEGPTTTEWGWRQVSAKDPDGFRIIVYDPTKSGG